MADGLVMVYSCLPIEEIRRRARTEEMHWCTREAYEQCQANWAADGSYPGHKDYATGKWLQDCDPLICRAIAIEKGKRGYIFSEKIENSD